MKTKSTNILSVLILLTLIFFSCISLISTDFSEELCLDDSCIRCSKDGKTCFECEPGFEKHNYRCGKKSCPIKHCKLCNAAETGCVLCLSNCKFNGKECNCTERIILIVCLTILCALIVGIVIYCLTHVKTRSGALGPQSIFTINDRYHNYIQNRQAYNEMFNNSNIQLNYNANERKPTESELVENFNKDKIKVINDIENKKCENCKVANCNLQLGCGCFVCFNCEQKMIKDGNCEICKDKINSMQQLSCSICFMNKSEISFFNCQCKMIICKDCYIKWRMNNKLCPACRTNIE